MWAPSLILFRVNHGNEKTQLWLKKTKNLCHIFSNEESSVKVAHEDLVNDPTKKIATKAERKFQPRWLKATCGWIMIKKTTE